MLPVNNNSLSPKINHLNSWYCRFFPQYNHTSRIIYTPHKSLFATTYLPFLYNLIGQYFRRLNLVYNRANLWDTLTLDPYIYTVKRDREMEQPDSHPMQRDAEIVAVFVSLIQRDTEMPERDGEMEQPDSHPIQRDTVIEQWDTEHFNS